MQLEIINPEKKLFRGEVDAVQLPGKEGLFQILDSHAAMIAVLKEGTVKIDLADDHQKFNDLNGHIERDKSDDKILRMQIKGGVVEVSNNKVIVLAD